MTLTAILIGNETLTRECGVLWLERGHRLAAVVTASPEVRAWAEGQGVEVQDPEPDLARSLPRADWLLSIANLTVLGPDLLARAAKGAVNFHDGPLPQHAGLNAPVWALLAGEAEHGVTWHLIDGGVDEGRVLEVRSFPVAEGETALTLNTRCFEAGLESFPAVISQLESGPRSVPQAEGARKVHRRADRPAAQGRIDFARPVETILRLVRGLDHGSYWNPLSTAKLDLGRRVLNVGSADAAPGAGVPGTVLLATAEGLVVACADGAVRLSRLTCQSRGLAVDPATVTERAVPALSLPEAERLTAALAAVIPAEARARAALRDLAPVALGAASAAPPDWQRLPLTAAPEALALAALRALGPGDLARVAPGMTGYLSGWAPLRLTACPTLGETRAAVQAALAVPAVPFPLDLLTRDAGLAGLGTPPLALADAGPVPGSAVTLTPTALYHDAARLPGPEAAGLAARLTHLAARLASLPDNTPWAQVSPLLPEEEAALLALPLRDHDRSLMVHTAFEAQVARTPDAPALSCEGQTLTYRALNAAANRAAHALIGMGVTPGTLVGLCTRRAPGLVIGALAIMKAGGAYVPMDPGYPADRLQLYAEDSGCPVIVTESALAGGFPGVTLSLDADPRLADAPDGNPATTVAPQDLCYLIYTSGSTGRPKGVMVEHRNVINFFAGMDDRLGTAPGVWLAVTSLSFDISVLELFWTLARGYKVVLSSDENRALVASGRSVSAVPMDVSLYYWGNDDGAGAEKYRLLLEGARFADQNGFAAVWTPERHFHAFGGPYPNPSVTGAAVAAVTKNLAVRAGSCVAPLHHPARIAEEWAVIDNLTGGRAGIAFASGWQPDDFVLRPENTPPANKAALLTSIDQVRRLWRGEAVDFPTAKGTFPVTTQPRPISKELPVWVTTAGNPDTWREAGAMGANVLTHLLGQTVDEVAAKIALYHAALRGAGHDPANHHVSLMLHTYLAATRDQAREIARAPMKDYLRSAAGLIKQYAWAFPAFKKPAGAASPLDIDLATLSVEEMDAILDHAFQRYFDESGLFGTVEDAIARIEGLKAIGVTEVACLIDYGIAPDTVLAGLRPLAEAVRAVNAGPAADDWSIAAQLRRHRVSHLQCTPSMARMIAMNDDSRAALRGVQTLLLGGEALPGSLVTDLQAATPARILNMYGPTETTIWSSAGEVTAPEPTQNIGTPLANQQLLILNPEGTPVPPGTEGELWIGGEGVTRGYWQRPDLTADRFRVNPFGEGRIYGTGDLARMRADGRVDFLGRADHQVKLRGFRIELGEIEAALDAQPGVTQSVVLAREDSPGDLRLVGYATGGWNEAQVRAALTALLPAHMLPAHLVRLDRMPLTPNRKIDRKALPAPRVAVAAQAPEPVEAGAEAQIAAIWARLLGVPKVGPRDNFFALGGHSLLAVQVHREIRQTLGADRLSITDIFRFPVLQALADHVAAAGPKPAPAPVPANDRAEARTDAMSRRRAMRAARAGA